MTCLPSYDVIIVLETASCLGFWLNSQEVGGSFWRFFFNLAAWASLLTVAGLKSFNSTRLEHTIGYQ